MNNEMHFILEEYYSTPKQKIGMVLQSLIATCILFCICLLMLHQHFNVIWYIIGAFFGIMAIFVIYSSFFNWKTYLEITQDGVAYYGYGFSIYSPWKNIIGTTHIVHPYNPYNKLYERPVNAFVLKEAALIGVSIREGKKEGVAVIEKHWGLYTLKLRSYTRYFPLLIGDLSSVNLLKHGIAKYIYDYAPQAFEGYTGYMRDSTTGPD